ncbi:MAG: S-methyl-5'-thioadenosine phosphorylase [Acidobacteria bacterium]|nr:S-methyl-5'-thioadenosine phosphorylase [Acidobacteriota bacterium]
MEQIGIGIIGGSGLYDMKELAEREEMTMETPFGAPSENLVVGRIHGRRVAFLARHGRGHRLIPSELNFRANIYALKMLGVERILSASAVGSLREEIAPLDIVLPDQFVDRTRGRIGTFFGQGLAAHVNFADPVCPELMDVVCGSARAVGLAARRGGTYLCMEGPAFSTRAESNLYRRWGMDVIGMTNLQEAKLAREAEICYLTLALVTDYDCWHDDHDSVSVDLIIQNLQQNSRNAQSLIVQAVQDLPPGRSCSCGETLRHAMITDRSVVPEEARRRLRAIVGKYFDGAGGSGPKGES